MAVHWRILGCADSSYRPLVLWMVMAIASGIDGYLIKYSGDIETSLVSRSLEGIKKVNRIKRTTDPESIQPISESSSEFDDPQDLEENPLIDRTINGKSIGSKESDKGFDLPDEQTKPKQFNKLQKYLANDLKNHSSNKLNLETKYIPSNDSVTGKKKTDTFGSQVYTAKYSSPNVKDLNNNFGDNISKGNMSNSTFPNKYTLEKKKIKQSSDTWFGSSNVTNILPEETGLNETLAMNDQPVEGIKDLSHNATDLIDDDLFDVLKNSTDSPDGINNTTSADGRTMPPSEGMNILIMSSIGFGVVVILGLIAGGGFVVYRHRIWNKPQTLSDKCSNADSSGYIDDSTLRENSEEMYSLDNDSFLNSLEAMTIQNYWTDNVKHTKL